MNILSVTFTVTLIGIGIDYGVYYVARYLQLRGESLGCEAAIMETSPPPGRPSPPAPNDRRRLLLRRIDQLYRRGRVGNHRRRRHPALCRRRADAVARDFALMDGSGWGVQMPKPWPCTNGSSRSFACRG